LTDLEAEAAFRRCQDLAESLSEMVQQLVSMPRLNDPEFIELERQFVTGKASEDDIRAFLRRRGIWARIERPDGSADFFGDAVPLRGPCGLTLSRRPEG
jgi:hypothetical protein